MLASAANGTLFASLIFGYFFLWVVAPNWPPPGEYGAYLLEPVLISGGAILALLCARMGTRNFARARVGAMATASCLALTAVVLLLSGLHHLPSPTEHAFAAVGWVLTSYAIFSAAVGLLIQCFVRRRIASGHVSAARPHELRIAAVWSDYGSGVTIVVPWLLALSGDVL